MTEEKKLLISRIELGHTEDNKPVAEMYEENPRLKYPSLRLFELSKLFAVGIDPNELEHGEERFVRFYAWYVESDRLNGQGNPYKDITRLEAIEAKQDGAMQETLDAIVELLQGIEHHVTVIRQATEVLVTEALHPMRAVDEDGQPMSDAEKAQLEKAPYHPDPQPEPKAGARPTPKPKEEPVLDENMARRKFSQLAGPAIREGTIDITVPGKLTAQIAAKAINWRTALQQLEAAIAQGGGP